MRLKLVWSTSLWQSLLAHVLRYQYVHHREIASRIRLISTAYQGYLTDRWGPRPLSLTCCIGYIPILCILMIDKLPLAAFIVILCFCGVCSGLINAVGDPPLLWHGHRTNLHGL